MYKKKKHLSTECYIVRLQTTECSLRPGAQLKQPTVYLSYERRPSFTELCNLDPASSDLSAAPQLLLQ